MIPRHRALSTLAACLALTALNLSISWRLQWRPGGGASIRANLQPDDLLSVQVAWFPGWKAPLHGQPTPVSADGMGFLVVQPHCQGDCAIDLAWTGPRDLPITALISLATLILLGAMIFRPRRPRRNNEARPMRAC